MKTVSLVRYESTDQGTFGRIEFENNSYYTLELPWRGNRNNISCIPAGIYKCDFIYSPRFRRKTYLLDSVINRTAIRIHSGNFAGDTEIGLKSHLNGCIALGKSVGEIRGQKALLDSKKAVSDFETILKYQPFILEIKNET